MQTTEDALLSISDTAFWVAQYRADESMRPDALFKDPLASKLIKSSNIHGYMDPDNDISWPLVIRTYLFDQVIVKNIHEVDTVLCLAAGLDTRPYRLNLPRNLRWIEVDLEEILTYKDKILVSESPGCNVERIPMDLRLKSNRSELMQRINETSKKTMVISEGLLVYLERHEVGGLSRELAGSESISKWVLDLASPGLLEMMIRKSGDKLEKGNAPFKFGPEEGPGFFTSYGWHIENVHSIFKTAASFKRVNRIGRLLALLPESNGKQGSRPWSGVCELTKIPEA